MFKYKMKKIISLGICGLLLISRPDIVVWAMGNDNNIEINNSEDKIYNNSEGTDELTEDESKDIEQDSRNVDVSDLTEKNTEDDFTDTISDENSSEILEESSSSNENSSEILEESSSSNEISIEESQNDNVDMQNSKDISNVSEEDHMEGAIPSYKVSALLTEDEKELKVIAKGDTFDSSEGALRFAIWHASGNQSDLRWINLQNAENGYEASIQVNTLNGTGEFVIHTYFFDKNGTPTYVGGTRTIVSVPSMGEISTGALNDETGKFTIYMEDISSKSGIKEVRVAVWCEKNQSDLYWYIAEVKNGYCEVIADVSNHKFHNGNYKIHVYVNDNNNFVSFVGGCTKDIFLSGNNVYVKASDKEESAFTISTKLRNYKATRFAVWSQTGGQDDLKWYDAKKTDVGFSYTIQTKDLKETGTYLIHAYGFDSYGNPTYINASSFSVSSPTLAEFEKERTENGFEIKIEGIHSVAGIKTVDVAVWGSGDQSDLKWYTAEKKDDSYYISVDIANHKMITGEYLVDVYVTDGHGIKSYGGGTTCKVCVECEDIQYELNENGCTITVHNITFQKAIESMEIAVWSDKNGQDDLKWHKAVKDGDDYSIVIPIEQLTDVGKYYAHTYITGKDGSKYYIIGTIFKRNTFINISDVQNGIFVVLVDALEEDCKISVSVSTKDNQSDIKWFTAEKQTNGQYTADIALKEFGYTAGDYSIQVYTYLKDGSKEKIYDDVKSVVFNKGTMDEVIPSENKITYKATLKNVDMKGIEKEIRFGVWSENEGQDDFRWFTAAKTDIGYEVDIPIAEYNEFGKYYLHAYCFTEDNTAIYMNGITFVVEGSLTAAIEIRDLNRNKGTFKIVEYMGNVGFEVKGVRVGVWCDDGSANVIWYNMTESQNLLYSTTVDVKTHSYEFGEYVAHVYAEDAEGELHYINGIRTMVTPDNMVAVEEIDDVTRKVSIYGANLNGTAFTTVKMPTWTVSGNQDDCKWLVAEKSSDGEYYVIVNRSDYKRSGEYATHVYGYIGETPYMLDGVTYTIKANDEFDEYAQAVMHNIIYAVETGGQIYGKAKYDNFSEAYGLTSKETGITIGAASWHAKNAQDLLLKIREANPILFASLDTAGISDDLDNENWTHYGGDGNGNATILKGSEKAVCIQKLISTSVGMKIQDSLVDVQMIDYVGDARRLGVTDLKGQMFCANIQHLGGYSAMSRVISWCKEDKFELTMDNLYTSMRNHTTNKTGNGVGANRYVTRHTKVMGWLKQYII